MNKLFKNYIYNSFYQVLTIIIPLVTTPYLTRHLGSNSLGISTYVLSVVTLYYTIGSLGIDLYSRREVAYSKANNKNLKVVFYELLIARLVLLVLTVICYIPFVIDNRYRIYYVINLATLLGLFLDTSWFFIGIEKMKEVVVRNTTVKLITTILIFSTIKNSNDLFTYVFIYAISQFISCLIMVPNLHKYLKEYSYGKINISKHMRPVFYLFLPQAGSVIYTQFDKIMIGMLSSDISFVTIYEKAYTIINLPLKFITALSTVVLPRTAGLFAKKNYREIKRLLIKILDFTMLIAIPTIIGLSLVADIFLPFYLGEEYLNSISVLRILSFATIAVALSNITGVQYLMAVNKTKILTFSYIIAAIVNLTLNYVLISFLNANGAAIATAIAEWIVFLIQYHYMCKKNMSLNIKRMILNRWIPLLVLVIVVQGTRVIFGTSIISGLLQIFLAIISYFIALYAIKDETLMEMIGK